MDARKAFDAEVIAEATGKSRKKWALLLVAFLAGVMAVVWLVRRAQSVEPAITIDPELNQERIAEPISST